MPPIRKKTLRKQIRGNARKSLNYKNLRTLLDQFVVDAKVKTAYDKKSATILALIAELKAQSADINVKTKPKRLRGGGTVELEDGRLISGKMYGVKSFNNRPLKVRHKFHVAKPGLVAAEHVG